MNEVRTAQVSSQFLANSTSSNGAAGNSAAADGKSLPLQSVDGRQVEASQTLDTTPKSLQSVVASVNDYIQSVQRDLQFSVDQELEQTIIRVVDGDSGEVIRQIPEDIFLELARRLKDDGEFRLLNALG